MIAGVKAMAVTKQIVLREWAKRPKLTLGESKQRARCSVLTLKGLFQQVKRPGFTLHESSQGHR